MNITVVDPVPGAPVTLPITGVLTPAHVHRFLECLDWLCRTNHHPNEEAICKLLAYGGQMTSVLMNAHYPTNVPGNLDETLRQLVQQRRQMKEAMTQMGRTIAQTANRQAYSGQSNPYSPVPNTEGQYPNTVPNFQPITTIAVIEAARAAQLRHWELFYFGVESHGPLPARRLRIAQEVGVNGMITTTARRLH